MAKIANLTAGEAWVSGEPADNAFEIALQRDVRGIVPTPQHPAAGSKDREFGRDPDKFGPSRQPVTFYGRGDGYAGR